VCSCWLCYTWRMSNTLTRLHRYCYVANIVFLGPDVFDGIIAWHAHMHAQLCTLRSMVTSLYVARQCLLPVQCRISGVVDVGHRGNRRNCEIEAISSVDWLFGECITQRFNVLGRAPVRDAWIFVPVAWPVVARPCRLHLSP